MMTLDSFTTYCLDKKGVESCFPFDDRTLVFKVMGKMFALTSLEGYDKKTDTFTPAFQSVNLKCDPERAEELRATYEAVQPGYHMSKKHWNTVYMDGSFDNEEFLEWVDHSYVLVVKSLTKKLKEELEGME